MSITISKFEQTIEKTKSVDYHGWRLEVPVHINWIAINPNGHMMGFEHKPEQLTQFWAVKAMLHYSVLLGTVEYNGRWQDSLMELVDFSTCQSEPVKVIKTVEYFGYIYKIPVGCQYMATDIDGQVFAYVDEPYITNNDDTWVSSGHTTLVAKTKYTGDWRESMIKVTEC